MLTKSITYSDYNGVEHTKDFYFNLNAAELNRLNFTTPGGLEQYVKNITENNDVVAAADLFDKLITMSVGEKSEDGLRFIKSKEITDAFVQSEAYSVFFMEVLSNRETSENFVNHIIPDKLRQQIEQQKLVNK